MVVDGCVERDVPDDAPLELADVVGIGADRQAGTVDESVQDEERGVLVVVVVERERSIEPEDARGEADAVGGGEALGHRLRVVVL